MLTKAGTGRTAIQQALVFVLAMAAGSCGRGAPADGVVQDRTTSALSGPWIYYPLDALNNWWAGYHAYGFNCPGPNCIPCEIHNAYDLAGPLNAVVRAAAHGTVVHVVNSCGSSDGSCARPGSCPCDPGYCGSAGGRCGNSVTIKHDGPGDGRWTKYCHLNSVTVPVNNPDGTPHVVEVGDQIGTLGQTEAYCNDQNGVQHVHFAVSNTENGGWGCVVGANQANCIDPGSPPGEGSFDKGCAGTVTPNVEWVTTTGGATKLAKDYCTPEPRATTCGRLANLAGGPVCGPGYTNNCNQPVECGPCAGGQVCNGGGMCAAAATVNVQVYTGAGTISVKRNNGVAFTGDAGGPATGSTTTSLLFPFAVGDTYSFSAAPSSGNLFVKFCGDAACSITTTSNPFSGNITAPQGNVFGYFNPCDSDSRTCHLLSNLAGTQVCGRDWTNNCGQKVTCNCSSSTTQTCDQTPGSPTDGTCVNRSGALYGFFDCVVGCVPNCSGKNCGDDGCGGYCGSGTGTCPAGYVCSGGNCVIPPTCPTGTCNTSNATGWCGAGYYCNSSGIANGAANTLYYCSSAGGYATSPRYCNEECHFEPGLNDQCWEDTSSCSYWRNYYVYACGWDSVNGNPRINYSCYYGSKSIHQWCAPGRCAWGSVNDYCY